MAENVRFGKTTEEICKNLVENSTPSAIKSATNFGADEHSNSNKTLVDRVVRSNKALDIKIFQSRALLLDTTLSTSALLLR